MQNARISKKCLRHWIKYSVILDHFDDHGIMKTHHQFGRNMNLALGLEIEKVIDIKYIIKLVLTSISVYICI